ncbi:MAG: hypothetical protein WA631_18755 [Nitrososphaeraceae archaeon]
MNKPVNIGLVITVIFSIGLVGLPQPTRASVGPYSPPCQDADIETRGGCCPDGTQIVHNMCLTQDEIDERNAKSNDLMQCSVENGLSHNLPGLLECDRNFFGP